ncbi:MAG: ribonuclease III [Pseudomonadota bacterium]
MAGPDPTLTAAAERLGHAFRDLSLLDEALTHPSATSPARPHNQRLEFLGDRVLGLCIAEALVARFPDEAEGDLAPRLNELVRKETCAEVARAVGVDHALRLGKSEVKTGGKRKTAILGDAMEAVIAAIYLDGGEAAARAFVMRFWGGKIDAQGAEAPRDAKTHLQEWAQGKSLKPPRYETVGRSGPDHAPVFRIAVSLQSGERAEGEARSKRAAEQEAAAKLIAELGL